MYFCVTMYLFTLQTRTFCQAQPLTVSVLATQYTKCRYVLRYSFYQFQYYNSLFVR
jgi:hypothetical protein